MFYMPKQASGVSGNMSMGRREVVASSVGEGAKIQNELCRALATGILAVH